MATKASPSFSQFLEGVRAAFYEVIDQGEEQVRKMDAARIWDEIKNAGPLVRREDVSGRARLEVTYTTGMEGDLAPTGEGQPIPETDFKEGIITTIEPYKFSRKWSVTYEAWYYKSPRYTRFLDGAAKLRYNAMKTLTKHTLSVFNNARTDPANLPKQLFAYGDNKKLLSTQHPLVGGGVQSNVLESSPQLSTSALTAAYLKGINMKDDVGEPISYFDAGTLYLVVPPALLDRAKEIVNTANAPYTANYVFNIWQGAYNIVSSPYLSSTFGGSDTRWFLVSGEEPLIRQFIFQGLTADTWEDKNTQTIYFSITGHWRIGCLNWRLVVGSEGDGSLITD